VGIEGLAERHGGRLDLPVAHAHVVHHAEAGDHLGRALPGNVATAPSDHQGELALVVEGAGDPGQVDRIVRPADAGDLLVEKGGEIGPLPSRLLDVLGVVEADRQALAGANRRLQTDLGEGDPVPPGPSRLGRSRESGAAGLEQRAHLPREIRGGRREIHHLFAGDDSEAGRAGVREGDELHGPDSPGRNPRSAPDLVLQITFERGFVG
jgi:hypothetical protein